MIQKPFCLVTEIDWTEPPREPVRPLKKLYTELKWTEKSHGMEEKPLENLTHLLLERQFEDGPVRILVQGEF